MKRQSALIRYRKVIWVCVGLFSILAAAAILFPLFAQAKSYSGPGLIAEALILNRDGTRAANRTVRLTLRGRAESRGMATTNAYGHLKIDRNDNWVDGVQGFSRVGTVKGQDGRYRPIFLEGRAQSHEDWFRLARAAGKLDISWP